MTTAPSRFRQWAQCTLSRSRLRTALIFVVLGGLIVSLMATIAVVRSEPDVQTITLYACVRNDTVIWVGRSPPAACPSGSELIRDDEVEVGDQERSLGHRLTVVLRSWLSIPGVMAVLVVTSLFWIRAGWSAERSLRALWLLVPILALVAAACVAGPGHWFAKEPWEGPSIVSLGRRDAITLLDLVGLTIAMLAIALAIWLAARRWGSHPR